MGGNWRLHRPVRLWRIALRGLKHLPAVVACRNTGTTSAIQPRWAVDWGPDAARVAPSVGSNQEAKEATAATGLFRRRLPKPPVTSYVYHAGYEGHAPPG